MIFNPKTLKPTTHDRFSFLFTNLTYSINNNMVETTKQKTKNKMKKNIEIKKTSFYFPAGKKYPNANARICPSLRLGYSMVWQTPLFKNVEICRIEKRYMLNLARRLLYGEQGNIPRNARGFATWRAETRIEMPVKLKNPPPMAKDPVTGYEIMHATDFSGKNHLLLNQWDKRSETYFVIRGSFTTSYSPFKGKMPIFISDITLEGYAKFQFLHIYDEPKLMRISDTIGMDYTTMFLPPNEQMDELIRQNSPAGLDILPPT